MDAREIVRVMAGNVQPHYCDHETPCVVCSTATRVALRVPAKRLHVHVCSPPCAATITQAQKIEQAIERLNRAAVHFEAVDDSCEPVAPPSRYGQ